MPMNSILAIDAGTSVNRAILFDMVGNILYQSKSELEIEQPYPGWAEQDPEIIWRITCENIRNAVKFAKKSDISILGVGITGHMHGTFLVNDKGEITRKKAIIWLDTRTSKLIDKFNIEGTADMIFKVSGWRLIPSMQLLHLAWLKENEPENISNSSYFLTCKDYIRLRLTGEVLTDFSDASFTGLFDNMKLCWSKELFDIIEIPFHLAPKLSNSWDVAGYITDEAAKMTNLDPGLPVCVGCGDVAAMALGSGVVEKNQLLANIGAAGVYERPVEDPLYDWTGRRYAVACHAVPNKWLLQANQMSAGLTLKWFRENILKNILTYQSMDELAAKSSPGAGGLIFLPYLQGERSPFVDPYVRGLFFGLSLMTKVEDVIRAIIEGVSFSTRDNLDVLLLDDAYENVDVVMSGGGANSRLWPQILADVLGTTVKIPKVKDSGALGAAILAALAIGVYNNYREAVNQMVKIEAEFKPNNKNKILYDQLYVLFKELYLLLKDHYKKLADLIQ